MSKVEKALQKVRVRDEDVRREDVGKDLREDVRDVPMSPALEGSQQLVPRKTELRLFKHEISRMAEPWRLSEADLAESKIIFPEMEHRPVADAFRSIRTRILEASPERNCSVVVTSVTEGGGSSFVALNLATAFAFDENRTALLFDCNLREPSYDFLAAPTMQYGLTDYLESAEIEAEQIIHPSGVPRVRVVPAGRRSEIPTEHLGSAKMRDLLSAVKQRYQDRFVIIDTPDMSSAADARILAAICDFVVLVVPYGRVTESQIWNAAKSIDESKFLGVVFNDQPQLAGLS